MVVIPSLGASMERITLGYPHPYREIDGSVFLARGPDLKPGDIVRARVTHADAYDLWASVGEYVQSAPRA